MKNTKTTATVIDETEKLCKKLIFRAGHRGTKEMDILLGGFATVRLPNFDLFELQLFEKLLECPDPDIYNWVTGQETISDPALAPMIAEIQDFYKMMQ